MNRVYRLVWNALTRTYVAVSETAKARGKAGRSTVGSVAASLALLGSPAYALSPNALPTGGTVVAGSASISQAGNTLNIQQATQRAAIDWQSFNIGAAATVNFQQPNSSAIALNRIVGNEASQIYGKLNANGQVFFINPNGMLFARGAQVNVGGLLASTMALSNEAFMAGSYRFTSPGSGALRNEGLLQASGSVVLLGNEVSNAGNIIATTVTLAAGNQVSVDLTGDGLIRARVDEPSLKARLENSGSIDATLAVTLTAGQARDMLDRVVNNSGQIRATGLVEKNGEILLEAASVENSGTLDVSSTTADGGRIDLLASERIDLADSSRLLADGVRGGQIVVKASIGDTLTGRLLTRGQISAQGDGSAAHGGFVETSAAWADINAVQVNTRGGTWLLDPDDVEINSTATVAGATLVTQATVQSALTNNNFTVQTNTGASGGNGDIVVNGTLSWGAGTTLTLNAVRNIVINQSISATDTYGKLALYYGQGSVSSGNTSTYSINAPINLRAGQNFSTKQGSNGTVTDFTVVTSLGTADDAGTSSLQGIKNNLSGNYVLGADINATSTSTWNSSAGFTPIGNLYNGSSFISDNPNAFNGKFDGLGHSISQLVINRPSAYSVGLFNLGATAYVKNLLLDQANIFGLACVGSVAGVNRGLIENVRATGTVRSTSGAAYYFGGLVGINWSTGLVTKSSTDMAVSVAGNNSNSIGGLVGYDLSGSITDSFATGSVTASGGATQYIGGLVGWINGGTVARSYASGEVKALNGSEVGGLVGSIPYAGGSISNSYATGKVSGNTKVGGLLGYNGFHVTNSYASGAVSGTSNVGGLVGQTEATYGSVSNSYWDQQTSGQTTSAGGTALGSSVAAMTQSNYTDGGWDFATVWWMSEGSTRPFLRSEWRSTITNAHQLQLMSMNPSASYQLANTIDLASPLAAVSGQYPGMWGSAGFAPVPVFSGRLDGQGYVISNLRINRSVDKTGLFGETNGATISNLGLSTVDITGGAWDTGALVGYNQNSSISNAYSSGTVRGTYDVGGLVGKTLAGSAILASYSTAAVSGQSVIGGLVGYATGGTISQSYSQGTVTGSTTYQGGLVGYNMASITDSYSTASVSGGTAFVGGLVGRNEYGTINNVYSTGTVSGQSDVGGLVGNFNQGGSITNAYWDTQTSTRSQGIGSGLAGGVSGLTSVQMKQMASFGGWNLANSGGSNATWRIYEGQTAPLLMTFLKPLVLANTTSAYNGNLQSGASTAASGVQGSAASGQAAGSYVSTYYSLQQGYDLSGGALTITPVTLSITGSLTGSIQKIYDGTDTATLSAGNFLLSGWVGSDGATVTKTSGTYVDGKNVGSGLQVSVSLVAGDFSPTGNTQLSNYVLPSTLSGLVGLINKRTLTVTADSVSKVYDGTTSVLTAPAISLGNVVAADLANISLTATGTYDDPHAAQSKTVSYGSLVLSGSAAGNYTASAFTGSGDIAPRSITGNLAGSVQKVYDGNTAATLGTVNYQLAGWVAGEGATVTKTSGVYTNGKNVGTELDVSVSLSTTDYSASGGARLSDYTLPTTLSGLVGQISPRTLTVASVDAVSKTYDGTTAVTATPVFSLNNVVADDTSKVYLTATGNYGDRHVASDKPVTYAAARLSGEEAGNYVLGGSTTIAGRGSITPLSEVTWVGGSSGNWSAPANWAGGALPDGGNVLAVTIPANTTVTFDGANTQGGFLGYASLNQLSSLGNLKLTGGTLTIGTSLSTYGYEQTGGQLGGAGDFAVINAFAKTGGTFTPTGVVNITQTSGDLDLTNEAVIRFGSLQAVAGNIDIDNTGGITLLTLASAPLGHVELIAHSPIDITGNINAGSGITLSALTPGGTSNVVINGSLQTSAGDVSVASAGSVRMGTTGAITSRTGDVSITASGNITLASISAPAGSVTLDSQQGQIGSATPGVNNITAQTIDLDAATGIVLSYNAASVSVYNASGTVSITDSVTGVVSTVSDTAAAEAAAQAAEAAAASAAAKAAAEAAEAAAKVIAEATEAATRNTTTTTTTPAGELTESTEKFASGQTSGSTTGTSTETASTEKTEDKQQEPSVRKLAAGKAAEQSTVVANGSVQKPAEQIVRLDKPKGQMLVCH